jgi:hypothetical protein
MNKILKPVAYTLGVIAVIALFALLNGVFIMLLWNWLVPTIFGLGTITYLQGWGLSVLCSFLFKNSTTLKKD